MEYKEIVGKIMLSLDESDLRAEDRHLVACLTNLLAHYCSISPDFMTFLQHPKITAALSDAHNRAPEGKQFILKGRRGSVRAGGVEAIKAYAHHNIMRSFEGCFERISKQSSRIGQGVSVEEADLLGPLKEVASQVPELVSNARAIGHMMISADFLRQLPSEKELRSWKVPNHGTRLEGNPSKILAELGGKYLAVADAIEESSLFGISQAFKQDGAAPHVDAAKLSETVAKFYQLFSGAPRAGP